MKYTFLFKNEKLGQKKPYHVYTFHVYDNTTLHHGHSGPDHNYIYRSCLCTKTYINKVRCSSTKLTAHDSYHHLYISDGTFRRSQRKKMKLASPSTYVTKSVLECASYCDYSRDCPYFNYRSTSMGGGICQVPGVGNQGVDAVESADWSVYRRM